MQFKRQVTQKKEFNQIGTRWHFHLKISENQFQVCLCVYVCAAIEKRVAIFLTLT